MADPIPKPGNFTPRFGSTAEFERVVAETAGKDYRWFFDVYLRRAPLPELIETRTPGGLALRWQAGGPFPMPVEATVDGKAVRIAMADGTGVIEAPPGARVVIDPDARVLRRSAAMEAYRAWQAKP